MKCKRLACGLLLLACACFSGGCTASSAQLRRQMESFDPAKRIDAVIQAARRKDASLTPALVDRLDDEDPAVRMYAILALERLTGERLGYSYAAPTGKRREAVDSWRDYIARNRGDGESQMAAGSVGWNAATSQAPLNPTPVSASNSTDGDESTGGKANSGEVMGGDVQ